MKLYHINQEKLETAASKLKAISHPVRIAILELLSKEKMCVTDIYEQLGLGQATTSHHLNILRTNGVLISKRHAVSYTHLRAHETPEHLVCRLLLEKKKKQN